MFGIRFMEVEQAREKFEWTSNFSNFQTDFSPQLFVHVFRRSPLTREFFCESTLKPVSQQDADYDKDFETDGHLTPYLIFFSFGAPPQYLGL